MTINHPAIATQEETCFACPEMHEGVLRGGRRFRLRYRNGVASLSVWPVDEDAEPIVVSVEVGDALQGIFDGQAQRDATFARLFRAAIFDAIIWN